MYDPLYVWQVASAKDTALLAEETAFVSRLPQDRKNAYISSPAPATVKQPYTED